MVSGRRKRLPPEVLRAKRDLDAALRRAPLTPPIPVQAIETLDVGHGRPLGAEEAAELVVRTLRAGASTGAFRVLKVVHGKGRGLGGGLIREEVRFRLAGLDGIRAVIPGEDYEPAHPATAEMRTACDHFRDPDLGRGNAGITLVWVI